MEHDPKSPRNRSAFRGAASWSSDFSCLSARGRAAVTSQSPSSSPDLQGLSCAPQLPPAKDRNAQRSRQMLTANRPDHSTAHAAKNPVSFVGKRLQVHFEGWGKKKKPGAGNCLLVQPPLERVTAQRNTLLSRDGERAPRVDFMVDIFQQKRERENKIKPQMNRQAKG